MNARILIACSLTCLSVATLARAQAGGTGPLFASGLLVSSDPSSTVIPLGSDGSGAIVVAGTTLSPRMRLGTAPCAGVSATVDMTQILATPGATFSARGLTSPAGTDGLGFSGTANADGSCTLTTSLCCFSPPSMAVEWIARNKRGVIVRSGTCAPGQATFTLSPLAGLPQGQQLLMAFLSKKGYDYYKAKSDLRCTISNPCPVTCPDGTSACDVVSIELSIIWCITSPCPGQPGSFSAMEVAATGVPTLAVPSCAVSSFSWGVSQSTTIGSSGLSAGKVSYSDLSFSAVQAGVQLNESCGGDPDCADLYKRVVLSGLAGTDRGKTIARMSMDRIAGGDGNDILLGDYVYRNVAISVGAGTPTAPGAYSTTLKVFGQTSPTTGSLELIIKCVRNVDPAASSQSFACDASSIGSAQCRLELLDAEGATVYTTIAAATSAVTSPIYTGSTGATTNPLYETGADGAFKVKVIVPAGQPTGMLAPDGTFVSGAIQARWTPLVPKPQQISSLSVACDNLNECVIENVSVSRSALFSGIPVLAMGSASVQVLDSSLTCTAPSAGGGGGGSGGSFGVDFLNQTPGTGMGVSVACDVFTTPGASMPVKWMAPESIRARSMTFTNDGPGAALLTCAMPDAIDGATWQIVDNTGAVLASGQVAGITGGAVAGIVVAARITDPNITTGGTAPTWSIWDPKAELSAMCDSHNVVISGLTPQPITNARGIIIRGNCNREPCPVSGNPTRMSVSASGLPSFTVTQPVERRIRKIDTTSTLASPPEIELPFVASSGVSVSSFCDMPPPYACAPNDSALRLTRTSSDLSSAGAQTNPSITFKPSGMVHLQSSGVIHRDLAARSVRLSVSPGPKTCASPNDPPSGFVYTARGHTKSGHVTLLKVFDDDEPTTGLRVIRVSYQDSLGNPSTAAFRVTMRDSFGNPRGSFVCGTTDHFRVSAPTDPATGARKQKAWLCSNFRLELGLNGRCYSPTGTLFDNVSTVECVSLDPNVFVTDVSQATVEFHGFDSCDVGSIECDAPNYVFGYDHIPVGLATISPPVATPAGDRRLPVRNIGSSGQDGVEIKWRAVSAGVSFDPDCLLNPPSGSPTATMRHRYKGWDGTIRGRCDLVSSAPNQYRVRNVSCDGTTGPVSWAAYGRNGQLRANGTFSDGTSVNIAVSSLAPVGTRKHAINTKGAGANTGRSVCLSFIDEECDISWATGSASSVANIVFFSPSSSPSSTGDEDCDVVVTASGMTGFDLFDSQESFKGINEKGIKRCDTVSFRSTIDGKKQKLWLPANFRAFSVSNIGSSGQDGVDISYFERGDRPTQGQFHRVSVSYAADGWSWGETQSGGIAASSCVTATFKSRELTGHVTLIKISESEDPASGARTTGFDLSSLNVQDCIVECFNDQGVVIGTFPMVSGVSTFTSVPVTPVNDPPVLSLDSTGLFTMKFSSPRQIIAGTTSIAGSGGVRTRISQIQQTLQSSGWIVNTCAVRGVSLDALSLLDASTITSPVITQPPVDTTGCFLSPVTFTCDSIGGGTAGSHWEWRYAATGGSPAGPWIPVVDGMNVNPADGQPSFTAQVSGLAVTMTNAVGTSAAVTGGRREIRVSVSNEVGSSTPTSPAQWIVPCSSVADVASLGGAVGCDGQLTVDDLLLFLGEFFAGNKQVADVAKLGGSVGRDGQLTVDDLLVFLNGLFGGCR